MTTSGTPMKRKRSLKQEEMGNVDVVETLCVFFWVSPRRQILVSRRFGTLCRFHLQGLDVKKDGCIYKYDIMSFTC
jgi:hypothetical protein